MRIWSNISRIIAAADAANVRSLKFTAPISLFIKLLIRNSPPGTKTPAAGSVGGGRWKQGRDVPENKINDREIRFAKKMRLNMNMALVKGVGA